MPFSIVYVLNMSAVIKKLIEYLFCHSKNSCTFTKVFASSVKTKL